MLKHTVNKVQSLWDLPDNDDFVVSGILNSQFSIHQSTPISRGKNPDDAGG
jgi:hypothetical protein